MFVRREFPRLDFFQQIHGDSQRESRIPSPRDASAVGQSRFVWQEDFPLAGQQGNVPHLAQIHPHRIAGQGGGPHLQGLSEETPDSRSLASSSSSSAVGSSTDRLKFLQHEDQIFHD